jgi:hypothetical protein
MKYTPLSRTNLFADLDDLDAWLAGLGITQRNRLRIYRENLIAMRESEESIGAAAVFAEMQRAGRINEILASYVDGSDIVEALVCLRTGQVDIPDELLRRALDGPPDASRESPKSNQGRNAMFELSIGGMLARQNLKPTFSTSNPDVEFQFEGHRVLVECKRVLSENRTLPVISEGIRQLRKQVNTSGGEVGIVAVNISRVFSRGDGYWNAPANSDVHEILSEMIRCFIDSRGGKLLRKQDEAARGALFYAASPFYVEGLGYTTAKAGTFCAFDLNRDEFLMRLASSILV